MIEKIPPCLDIANFTEVSTFVCYLDMFYDQGEVFDDVEAAFVVSWSNSLPDMKVIIKHHNSFCSGSS